ncbi:metal ABC transporter ATP-binding protein [Candidatus Wolfebacteria bacterium]|nr:metal ABC transporter ATP-binding protein [Candidatus Wolfebacteria bacterium]
MPILEVKNLNVKLGKIKILDDINFKVEAGEVLAIIGPNGAGKTTLLKSLLGLAPYEGEIKWQPNIKIGYVPQRMDIETDIPLTVKEFLNLAGNKSPHQTKTDVFNIKKILSSLWCGGKISGEEIKEALTSVQLEESILKSGFGEISIGQRQRILIAWAILNDPQIFLFDEPTADIDIAGQESIYKILHDLQSSLYLTVILISHDLNIVYRYSDKVLCLNRKKICEGLPKDILQTERLSDLYGEEKAFYHHQH